MAKLEKKLRKRKQANPAAASHSATPPKRTRDIAAPDLDEQEEKLAEPAPSTSCMAASAGSSHQPSGSSCEWDAFLEDDEM